MAGLRVRLSLSSLGSRPWLRMGACLGGGSVKGATRTGNEGCIPELRDLS